MEDSWCFSLFVAKCVQSQEDHVIQASFALFGADGLLVDVKKEPKYRNAKCVYMGIKFDSYRERDRYIFLADCMRRGLIRDLRLQVRYELFPDEYKDVVKHLKTKDKIERKRSYIGIDYVADFVYEKGGVTVVEDVKPSPDVLPKDFQLKCKMMHYIHGIDLRLVYKPNEPI